MKAVSRQRQKKYFDSAKNQYSSDLIANPPLHTRLELEEIANRIGNKQEAIVDFASGTGRVAYLLLQKGFKVVAVDISRRSLQVIEKTATKLGWENLKTASKLPNEKIKTIVGADALHHVDIDYYLALFYNRLKAGGRIVFSEPGAWNISWHLYLRVKHDWQVEKGMLKCSYFNLTNLLKKNKFKNIKITGLGFFPRPFFNWSKKLCLINERLGDFPVLKLFAYRYIIEAEK